MPPLNQNNKPTQSQPQKPQPKPQKPQKQSNIDATLNSLTMQIRELTQRVRTLEEEISLMQKRLDVFNQNMLNNFQKNKEMIERQRVQIRQFEKDMIEMQELMRKLVKEINNFAKREELLRLEKYIDFWKPIKFVTYDGLERMVKRKVNEKIEDINMKLQIENYVKKTMAIAIAKFLTAAKRGKINILEIAKDAANQDIPEKDNLPKAQENKQEIKDIKDKNSKESNVKNKKMNKTTTETEPVDLISGEPL